MVVEVVNMIWCESDVFATPFLSTHLIQTPFRERLITGFSSSALWVERAISWNGVLGIWATSYLIVEGGVIHNLVECL